MAFRGDRLRQLRESRGYTQDELADIIDVGKQQFYRWENNVTDPSAEMVTRLAKEFQVTADYLLGLVDHPDQQLTEDDLTPMERKLLRAYRNGELREALQILSAPPADVEDESNIASH